MSDFSSNVQGNQSTGTAPGSPSRPPFQSSAAKRERGTGAGALLGYTLLALCLALVIRFFVAAPYVVSGSSMEPNFENWDYLITDRVSYRFEDPQRGDIIVFHLPQEYTRTLIKRIIGLPGETVSVDAKGIYIKNAAEPSGFYLNEPYLAQENLGGPMGMTVTLKPDEYFVLGDNRHVSSDSRSWGTLPRADIIGRVILRLLPFSKINVLPAEARYLEK
jgi:signal peptidase I